MEELWTSDGVVTTRQIADLSADDISQLLRSGKVRFVVANIGADLQWLPLAECFDFWKQEIRPHLAAPNSHIHLEDYAGGYAYIASQWESVWPEPVVLLTRHH